LKGVSQISNIVAALRASFFSPFRLDEQVRPATGQKNAPGKAGSTNVTDLRGKGTTFEHFHSRFIENQRFCYQTHPFKYQ
jgi:hypothetical protein